MEHQQFSNWIKNSSWPRAIADFNHQRFIAWNTTCLERAGYSEDRIKAIKPEEIIVLSQGDICSSHQNRSTLHRRTICRRAVTAPLAVSAFQFSSLRWAR